LIYSENVLVCIAIPLLISLFFIDRSSRRFIVAFVTGMVVCLLSAYISGFLNYTSGLGAQDTAVYLSPVIEELMKLLPLLFYLFVFYPDDKKFFIVAVGIGLGFATFENCCYILSSGAESLTYILIRGMAVGVMHLVCAISLVLVLSTAKKYKVLSIAGAVGALALSVTLHGLYNLLVSEPGASSYIGYILPALAAAALYIPGRKKLA